MLSARKDSGLRVLGKEMDLHGCVPPTLSSLRFDRLLQDLDLPVVTRDAVTVW